MPAAATAREEAPFIENVITAQGGAITYRVMTHRVLSTDEMAAAVWAALEEGRLQEPPPGGETTLVTEIGKPQPRPEPAPAPSPPPRDPPPRKHPKAARKLACQQSGGPMRKDVQSRGNLAGIVIALIVLAVGIVLTVTGFWPLGIPIAILGLFMGGKRVKIWKCQNCGCFFT